MGGCKGMLEGMYSRVCSRGWVRGCMYQKVS